MRVLICDDNVDSANTWAALLGSEGFDVRTSHFGRTCLEEALVWRPQAALIDIGMPDMNGYAVGRAIRAAPGGEAMLLIAVTGYDSPEDLDESRAAGFDHHFRKPAELPELLQALRTGREAN